MIKKTIEKDIIAYQFDAENHSLGSNAYVFLDGKNALVIDALYTEYYSQLIDDLKENDIVIKAVLPSHYHPDHIEGLNLLDNVIVYGTDESIKTLNSFPYTEEEKSKMMPTDKVKFDDTISFGSHRFTLRRRPGHSDCSMFIEINDLFVHTGDYYLTTNSGEDSLPYVSWIGVSNHMEALMAMKTYKDKTFLMSHGYMTCKVDNLTEGIDNRLTYLKRLLDSDNNIGVEEAVQGMDCHFVNRVFRDYVK